MREEELAGLLYAGESTTIEFKAEQYLIARPRVEDFPKVEDLSAHHRAKKSELLKDILAMSNAWRSADAYILIGLKERPPDLPEVLGLETERLYDDAVFQQFIAANVARKIDFSYAVRQYEGKSVGVIHIPLAQTYRRPYYCKQDFGIVRKDTVYVRRGTSTAVADPEEIARMGAYVLPALTNAHQTTLELSLVDEVGSGIPDEGITIDVPEFGDVASIPDYAPKVTEGSDTPWSVAPNRDYWRERAQWKVNACQSIQVTILLKNPSSVPITDCTVDLFLTDQTGARIAPLRQFPSQPHTINFSRNEKSWELDHESLPGKHVPSRTHNFKHFRPGEIHKAPTPLILNLAGLETVRVVYRILARELHGPIEGEVVLPITKRVVPWDQELLVADFEAFMASIRSSKG